MVGSLVHNTLEEINSPAILRWLSFEPVILLPDRETEAMEPVLTSGRWIHRVSRVMSAGPRFFWLRSIVFSPTVRV